MCRRWKRWGIWVGSLQLSLWYNAHVQFQELSVCGLVSCSLLGEGGRQGALSQRLHFCSFALSLIWSYNPWAESEKCFSSVGKKMKEITTTLLWFSERSISSAVREVELIKKNTYKRNFSPAVSNITSDNISHAQQIPVKLWKRFLSLFLPVCPFLQEEAWR